MQRFSAATLLIAALFLFCGCGRSPEKVFGDLKDAAVKKDAKTVWANITPETQEALAEIREGDSTGTKGASAGLSELEELAGGLSDEAIVYIKTLQAGQVSTSGDTALMSIGSARFGPVTRTLTFRKVNGKWLWDGREVLTFYMEHRNAMQSWEGF